MSGWEHALRNFLVNCEAKKLVSMSEVLAVIDLNYILEHVTLRCQDIMFYMYYILRGQESMTYELRQMTCLVYGCLMSSFVI